MKKTIIVTMFLMSFLLVISDSKIFAQREYTTKAEEIYVEDEIIFIKTEMNALYYFNYKDGKFYKEYGNVANYVRNTVYEDFIVYNTNSVSNIWGKAVNHDLFTKNIKYAYESGHVITDTNELYRFYDSKYTKIADDVKDIAQLYNTYGYYVLQTNGDLFYLEYSYSLNAEKSTLVMSGVNSIFSHFQSLLIITDNNELWGVGDNGYELLTKGNFRGKIPLTQPVYIMNEVKKIDMDNSTVGVLTWNNDLYMWGISGAMLGNDNQGDFDYYSVDKRYLTLNNVKDFGIGSNVTAAIRMDGSIWAWGKNSSIEFYTPQKIYDNEFPTYNVPSNSYKNASAWAISEITEADKYYLLGPVGSLSYKDNITRETFAEIVVKYYEFLTGTTATSGILNPFTDTKNQNIIKAYNLGIVKGKSEKKFEPKSPITREEIVVMLSRALESARPNFSHKYKYSRFEDEINVSKWALDDVKQMRSMGIVTGDTKNNFNPKNYTTIEEAVIMTYRLLKITD